MAKATIVKITRLNERGTVVCTTSGKFFTITSFNEVGVLNIEAEITDMTLNEFIEIVVGCFETRSSFRGVGWINFTYNNVTVNVTRGIAMNYSTEYIINQWEEKMKSLTQNKKMLSKVKRVQTENINVSNEGNINIERKDIERLNHRIRDKIEENEKKREKGLEDMDNRRNRY